MPQLSLSSPYYINQPIQLYKDLSVVLGVSSFDCDNLTRIISKVVASRTNRYYNTDKKSYSVFIPHIGTIYFKIKENTITNLEIKLDKEFTEGLIKGIEGKSLLLEDAETKWVEVFKDKYNSIL